MGNMCGTPSVNEPQLHQQQKHQAGGTFMGQGQAAAVQRMYGEQHTNAANASVGTQQSRTPHPHPHAHAPHTDNHAHTNGHHQVYHPSVSGSTTTTTTTTRETRENEKGDGLMPLSQPAMHEAYPPPRHHLSSNSNEDSPPQTIPLSWTKGKLIGAGAFGRVFQGLDDDTGQIVAVKQVALTKDETLKGRVTEHVRALEAEVAVLLQLNHRNIVRYLGTERTEDTLNIFLEYVPGGSIASLIEKFGPLKTSVIRMYAQQILKGLEYLHQKKIMHRDIKGANILVDGRGIVKLADFGASKKIENLATVGSGSKSIRGTPYWMAPEVIKQTGHGRPADIWSLACVVIEMATGKPPWSNCNTQVAAMFHIASTKEPPPLPEHLPPEAKDFLLLCFNRVPKDRPNATKLLRHPWMANAPQASPVKPPPPQRPVHSQSIPRQPIELSAQHSLQTSEATVGLEGGGSNTGPHGLPPLVPGGRTSFTSDLPTPSTNHNHHQHQPLYSGPPQPTTHSATPNSTNPTPHTHAPSPTPTTPQKPHQRPTAPPPTHTITQQHQPHRTPLPDAPLPSAQPTTHMQNTRAPVQPYPSEGGVVVGSRAGSLLGVHGVQRPPGMTGASSILTSLAQQRTAAPMSGATASPLKGAQLRSAPVPRPSPDMFPQPRQPHTQHSLTAQQQQSHMQQPQQSQQQPARAAMMASMEYNPMEEPAWGSNKKGGDQAPKDTTPLADAPRRTEAAASESAQGSDQSQSVSQNNRSLSSQERDSEPVRDSKMQNWRDGLIKEMASKRHSARPSAAAAAVAK